MSQRGGRRRALTGSVTMGVVAASVASPRPRSSSRDDRVLVIGDEATVSGGGWVPTPQGEEPAARRLPTCGRAIAALAPLTLLVALAFTFPGASLASDPTPEEALTELNQWRAKAGVPAVTSLNATSSEGCRLHNAYLSQNDDVRGLDRHTEHRERPGYSELGAAAGESSNLAGVEGGPRIWDFAVYHRLALLNPRLTTTGFDASSGNSCMSTVADSTAAGTPTLTLYPWPANGLRGVPSAFEGGESPDPYETVPGVKKLGYLLSVNVDGPWNAAEGSHSHLAAVSLTPDDGQPVAVTGADATSPNSWALGGGFAIFPHRPLQRGVWYTARAVGHVRATKWTDSDAFVPADYPFDLSWRFRTAPRGPRGFVEAGLVYSGSSGAHVPVTAVSDGTEVARRVMQPKERWAPDVPAGEYRVCFDQPHDHYVSAQNCTDFALLRISGQLRRGRASVRVSVPAVGAKRKVAVTVSAMTRKCVQLPSKRRYCGRYMDEVATRVRRVRRSAAFTFRVPRTTRRVQVRAGTSPVTVGGERHELAESVLVLRRR